MDENSCEGETSEKDKKYNNKENPVKIEKVTNFIKPQNTSVGVKIERNENQVLDNSGSSFDPTGPSFSLPPPTYENRSQQNECDRQSSTGTTPVTNSTRPHVHTAPDVPSQPTSGRSSIGPPPSYSFVMKQKKKGRQPSRTDVLTSRSPPPTYVGARGPYSSCQSENISDTCIFSSFQEPIWRSHSQPAFCPRCGILVLTTTHAHESIATHVAALALCLLGCWPCCFLPYCTNICKNTYHHCPICQAYLGVYTPW